MKTLGNPKLTYAVVRFFNWMQFKATTALNEWMNHQQRTLTWSKFQVNLLSYFLPYKASCSETIAFHIIISVAQIQVSVLRHKRYVCDRLTVVTNTVSAACPLGTKWTSPKRCKIDLWYVWKLSRTVRDRDFGWYNFRLPRSTRTSQK